MPLGRVHETFNLAVLAGLGAYAFFREGEALWANREALAFALAYLVGTFLLSPDLDLAERDVRPAKRWGLLRVLWWPYGLLFRHRGLSHTWVVGPLTRLGYLLLLLGLLGLLGKALASLLGLGLGFDLALGWPKEVYLAALLGYYLSQWLHLALDGIPPGLSLRPRRKARRAARRPRDRA